MSFLLLSSILDDILTLNNRKMYNSLFFFLKKMNLRLQTALHFFICCSYVFVVGRSAFFDVRISMGADTVRAKRSQAFVYFKWVLPLLQKFITSSWGWRLQYALLKSIIGKRIYKFKIIRFMNFIICLVTMSGKRNSMQLIFFFFLIS